MELRGFLYAVIAAGVVMLAACGGDDPTPTLAPAMATVEVTSPLAVPAAPAGDTGFVSPLSNQVAPHAEGEGGDHEHVVAATATDRVQVVIVPSELVVGPNRFAVGLLDDQGEMIGDADVHFHFVDLTDPRNAIPVGETDAEHLLSPDGDVAIYAHEWDFRQSGGWGVEVQVRWPDGRSAVERVAFTVLDDAASITPGESAPVVDTPTLASAGQDYSRLTSALEPNPAFYTQSLNEAVASGKPTLVLLVTPVFCRTRFCGPAYETTNALYARYGDRMNFIHLEIFSGLPDPAQSGWPIAPAVAAFGVESEPWVYLIDATGTVVYRVEGLFTADEIERELHRLLQL